MVCTCKTFIEGNRLLAKPRKVGTLRAYLTALQMFYIFLLTRATSLAKEFGLEQKDLDLIKEFHGRVSNWMKKSFTRSQLAEKLKFIMRISIHFSQAPKFGTYSIHQFMTNLKNNLKI